MPVEALGVLLAEDPVAGGRERLGAGGGVDHDRQLPLPAPLPEALDHLVRLLAVGLAVALRAPGRPQQVPPTSGGIQTGSPARPETATSASGRLGPGPCRGRRSGWCRTGGRRRRRPRASSSAAPSGRRPGQALAALGAAHQRAADPEAGAARPLDRAPPLRRPQRQPIRRASRAALAAQLLDQLAGVDPDRAGELAGAVGGAGLERVVLVLLEQGPLQRRAGRLARHLAPQDDPLARRRRQVAARADRLAEAALDAGRRRPPRSGASSSGCGGGRRGRG